MSDDGFELPRMAIDPEPTGEELVAIIVSMQANESGEPDAPPPSRWKVTARREQMRRPRDDRRTGWNR